MFTTAGPTAKLVVGPDDVRCASQELRRLVAGLDVDAVVTCEAPEVWAEFDAIERVIASAKVLLARRVEDARSWQGQGFRSVEDQLARLAGSSIAAAQAMLATSKQVAVLPDTAGAMRAGELSSAQAAAVAGAAAVAPDAEARLLALAVAQAPLAQLRRECLKARAGVDGDKSYERNRRERRAKDFTDAEGAWNLGVRGPVDAGARFRDVHGPIVEQMFKAARREGRTDSRETYAFDAFMEMVERAAGNRTTETDAPKKTPARFVGLIRVDHEALRRGQVAGDEVCEIVGLGPVPVRVARELLGDAILKLVITKGVDVANITHLGRAATVAQQAALRWLMPECIREGCTRTERPQIDHRRQWIEVHETRLDNLDPLCEHDHDLKTYFGWALVEGTGKRPMVPPDDPRHPNHRAPPPP
jgi:Domain of unknown function (DUF222)